MSFTPKILSQRDPRWINEKLGFDDTLTIGTDGSTLVCLAMLVNGYGFNETPSSLNRTLKDLGSGVGFLGSLLVWPGLTQAFSNISFRGIIVCRDEPAPISDINTSIDAGQPLLVEIDQSPSAGLQNHWVILYARQGNDYLMLDPWPLPPDQAPVSLTSRYGQGHTPAELITGVAWYDLAVSPVPVAGSASLAMAPDPAPGTGLYVRVQAAVPSGLTLRSSPSASAPAVAVEPPGTLLHCIEADAVALPKIGVVDLWLQVSDPAGLDGHVPAWNVDKVPGTSSIPVPVPLPPAPPALEPVSTPDSLPGPAPAPAPLIPAALTVLVLQSVGSVGLRLRSEPDTNSSTLSVLSGGQAVTVLEPASQALPKIGQVNQWLNVQDGQGNTGYVAAWYVEMGSPAASLPQPPASAALTVLVSTQASAGLRLRDEPTVNGNILKVLTPGTSLTVLEPAASAQAKLGVNNQWLNVKEPGGLAGYVAAWYVS